MKQALFQRTRCQMMILPILAQVMRHSTKQDLRKILLKQKQTNLLEQMTPMKLRQKIVLQDPRNAMESSLSRSDVVLSAFNRLGYLHPCKASIRNIDYQDTVSVSCWYIFL